MNYLPFDLETALKHPERVVTREGDKVTELHHFKTVHENSESVVAVANGMLREYFTNGKFVSNEHQADLFLIPDVKEVWVNVYDTSRGIFIGANCSTKVKAIDGINEDCGKYIKTICITNEPE